YTVILEEPAVAVFLLYLAYMGLDALSLQEERSFLSGKLGSRLVGQNVTLWDDGLDPRGLPQSFDFEGVAKRPVYFFRRGVAEAVVYDSFTGNREGKPSTGHALPAGATFGPLPMNIFLATGDSSLKEMIASTERGVLITTLHYTNILEPKRTLLTGMTRHGTFLIEGGRIVRPVKNLRFTQSAIEALNRVNAIGRNAKIQRESLALTVPAVRVEGFSFTGATR
ncbi:MAG TPA: metallopeptidase TldD-related protein, partial [Candidatus Methylomirabilis sp.]|nr:metallopeptidase TldD-related protein [Candidatus Methylomirabilis sp.]